MGRWKKADPHKVHVTICLNRAELRLIDEIAQGEGATRSELIRVAILAEIRRIYGKAPDP